MKSNLVAVSTLLLLLISLFGTAFKITLVTFGSPAESHKTGWKLIALENPTGDSVTGDFEINVSPSRIGVHMAGSTDITYYCASPEAWPNYTDWWEWLNGTATSAHQWDWMDWWATEGSLTNITYNEIKHWTNPEMYTDSGDVPYKTFMGNTYMADPNLTDVHNEPDIYPDLLPWVDNRVVLENQIIAGNTRVWLVLKIVMTDSGAYTFNMTGPSGITITPSSWRMGGLATILVPDEYPTIQEAINVASLGDTIIVDDGTYAEDLHIPATKTNLEIKPDAGASVTIKGVQNVPAASFPLAIPNIDINASGVMIHGFTIEGPDYTPSKYSSGIVIGASNVDIYNNTFKVTPAANTDEISQAIQTYHKNAKPGVDVSGLNIHNNTFTHLSAGVAGYEGIYINLDEGTNTATVQHNQFSGNVVRAITTERSKTTISGNIIITDLAPNLPGGYQGINVGGVNDGDVANVSVTGNTIKGSASGKGFMYGIKLGYASTSTFTNVSIISNTIEMNEVGVWVKFSASGVKVHWNNIIGNTNYGVSNTDTTDTINAAYNWWGNENGPFHTINNPAGTGDAVSDNVLFKPWLVEPYPPAVFVSELYVDPPLVEYWTPAYSSSFTVNVKLANVSLLYGFQFNLTWNNTLLNLVKVEYFVLWSNYFEVRNGTGVGVYSVAVTGVDPAPPFNGSATLATLTFKTVYDPIYPENVTSSLALVDTLLGRSKNMTGAEPIPHLVYSGEYFCYSKQPKIAVSPHLCEVWKHQTLTTFNVGVNITDVVNLYAYEIELRYNTSLLDVTKINIEPFFTSYRNPISLINDTKGLLIVRVEATSLAPPANGSGMLVTFTFQVTKSIVWDTSGPMLSSGLNLTVKELVTDKNVPIQAEIINGVYRYNPVPGDLSKDGEVDMGDLRITAQAFDKRQGQTGWDPRADINRDGIVNILDIIIVARNFGRTKP